MKRDVTTFEIVDATVTHRSHAERSVRAHLSDAGGDVTCDTAGEGGRTVSSCPTDNPCDPIRPKDLHVISQKIHSGEGAVAISRATCVRYVCPRGSQRVSHYL